MALLLAITPQQCSSRVEWCFCQQYVAMQHNRCQVAADELEEKTQKRARGVCDRRWFQGRRACDRDDGDVYMEPNVKIGEDR